MYHNPVLLKESVENLVRNPNGVYVDLTFGGGGHSAAILERLDKKGKLIAFDIDDDALKNSIKDKRFVLVNQNFRFLWNYLRYYDAIPVDGILADLGVSSHQIDDDNRGFSIRKDGDLDMRMNSGLSLSAKDVLNNYSAEDLIKVFRDYGELDKPHVFAHAVVRQREIKPFETTSELKEFAEKYAPKKKEYKYLSQVFQAVRIEVNQEIVVLEEMLLQIEKVLKVGGVAAIISYHSLEDRLVKNLFKTGNLEGEVKKDFYGNKLNPFMLVNRKPILPSDKEIELNGRARSAKLRIAEKI
ncbi:16S rRNA (cytosine(1402)-N(4))-methyltransferase RsmH [Odoribacter sp. OttesenSCG-928-L07]|nr:16S rRNA (cytosine(1402)-N(4))-methyltransferase RsmH [Odoribacter sp. OttesenSCG-928-L07]MDL2239197.1 16S rRNA (cytosine(1402)-N(4))-methyltransferase RsmH [Bacteroidales bacterium OttesenSCG-928-L14]MDL2240541.1 16S rRNA (cytosine(1402)-N(4))-methyltransferase RsmH [Bacteroidales bacterium OttesenSCG-928-K22]